MAPRSVAEISRNRRRLLVVAPYFPPRRRVGAERSYKFVRYLPELGIDTMVVCLETPGGALSASEQEALSPSERFELRTPFDRTSDARGAKRALERGSTRADLDRYVPIDSWWPLLMAQLPRVLRAARAFAPDAVWSTADPWSSHALARRIASAQQRPWIADFRDPWSLCRVRNQGRPSLVRAIDRRAERAYLRDASAVTFTAPRTTELYRAAYPEFAARFSTIENGFDPRGYPEPLDAPQANTAVAPGAPLVLAFFGRFRALSPATPIVHLIARLRAVDARAAGLVRVQSVGGLGGEDLALAERLGVASAFVSVGEVPRERTLATLRAADLLLLSTAPDRDEIIPAKLFDYLAAGRPVLSLCENEDVARILQRTGQGEQFPARELDAAAARLRACIEAKERGEPLAIGRERNLEAVREYAAPRLAERLAQLVESVIDARRGDPAPRRTKEKR
jgi:glycosyltransferase involved in cell wall biosynthesis